VLHMTRGVDDGRITGLMGRVCQIVAPAMPYVAKGDACGPDLAAILSERDLLRGGSVECGLLCGVAGKHVSAMSTTPPLAASKQDAKRLARGQPAPGPDTLGCSQRSPIPTESRCGARDAPRFVMSGGKGANCAMVIPLGWNVCWWRPTLDGDPRAGVRIVAAPCHDSDLRDYVPDQMHGNQVCACWLPTRGPCVGAQARTLWCAGAGRQACPTRREDIADAIAGRGCASWGLCGQAAHCFWRGRGLDGRRFSRFQRGSSARTLETGCGHLDRR